MIGRMPAPFARATASRASSRGGSIMPISPRKTRSLLDLVVDCLGLGVSSGSERKATPSVRSASPASASLPCQDRGAALLGQRPRLLAHQLVRAASQQHVGRALGEHEQRAPAARRRCGPCSSACARMRTAPRRPARSGHRAPRPPARPCARRRSARPRSGRPAPSSARRAPAATALLARSATISARVQLDPQRALDRTAAARG